MLLDEWTAEQDPEFRRKFYDELLPEMMRAGATVVVITHDDRYLDELHAARAPHPDGRRPYCRRAGNGLMIGSGGERLMAKYPESIDDLPPPRRRGWWRYLGRHLPGFSVVVLMAMLAVVVLWPYVVITVPSGRVGVLWKRFNGLDLYCWCWVGRGTVLDPRELREEGLHIIWPWDKLFLYDLRLQSSTQTYNAISKDGVNVRRADQRALSTAAQFRRRAAQIHRSGLPEFGRRSRKSAARRGKSFRSTRRKRFIRRGNRFRSKSATMRKRASPPISNKLVQPEADGAAGPQALQRLPAERDPNPRYAGARRSNCRRKSWRRSTGRPSSTT